MSNRECIVLKVNNRIHLNQGIGMMWNDTGALVMKKFTSFVALQFVIDMCLESSSSTITSKDNKSHTPWVLATLRAVGSIIGYAFFNSMSDLSFLNVKVVFEIWFHWCFSVIHIQCMTSFVHQMRHWWNYEEKVFVLKALRNERVL